jgi:hypothetical protein
LLNKPFNTLDSLFLVVVDSKGVNYPFVPCPCFGERGGHVEEVVTLLVPYLGIVNFDSFFLGWVFLGLFVVLVPISSKRLRELVSNLRLIFFKNYLKKILATCFWGIIYYYFIATSVWENNKHIQNFKYKFKKEIL